MMESENEAEALYRIYSKFNNTLSWSEKHDERMSHRARTFVRFSISNTMFHKSLSRRERERQIEFILHTLE